MLRKIAVRPKNVETKKTRKPSQLLNIKTTMLKKIRIAKESLLYFIFVINLEKSFARKIVRKKAKIPEIRIVAKIKYKSLVTSPGRIFPAITAAPVLAF